MKKAKNIISGLFLLINLLSFSFALNTPTASANLWDNQEGFNGGSGGQIGNAFGETSNDPQKPQEIVIRLIKIFLTFLGVIFLIMVMWAGFQWMTSEGNDDTVRKAKATIGRSIAGIIIILASYAITSFIGSCVMDIASGDAWYCAD